MHTTTTATVGRHSTAIPNAARNQAAASGRQFAAAQRAAQQQPGAQAEEEGAGRMLPQHLAADRSRAASQPDMRARSGQPARVGRSRVNVRITKSAAQRGQEGRGEDGAVPPPETVVFDMASQVEHGAARR